MTSQNLATLGNRENWFKTKEASHTKACWEKSLSLGEALYSFVEKSERFWQLLHCLVCHIAICKKVGRKIGALRRTYRQLTPTARRQFFVSVIQPDLEHAASATIPFMPTGQQDRLLALWKKAVRCLAGVHPQNDVLPLIRNLKLTLFIA